MLGEAIDDDVMSECDDEMMTVRFRCVLSCFLQPPTNSASCEADRVKNLQAEKHCRKSQAEKHRGCGVLLLMRLLLQDRRLRSTAGTRAQILHQEAAWEADRLQNRQAEKQCRKSLRSTAGEARDLRQTPLPDCKASPHPPSKQ